MENDQESRQPSRGPLSRGFDAFRTGRTLGKLAKTARLARTAGTATEAAAGAAATSEIWIPVLIVVLFLVVFLGVLTGGGTGEAAGIPLGTDQSSNGNIQTGPTVASDCPIASKVVTCGSKDHSVNGPVGPCGHCDAAYYRDNKATCDLYYNRGSHAIDYAMDIDGIDNEVIQLPKIDGHTISWTYSAPEGQGTIGFIQTYTGVDPTNKAQYIIGFHHTTHGSGNLGTHISGEMAGRIYPYSKSHVHVELSSGDRNNKTPYLDATQYFCKK